MAIVGVDSPGIRISRQNFLDISRGNGRLLDELPEGGFAPRLVNCY